MNLNPEQYNFGRLINHFKNILLTFAMSQGHVMVSRRTMKFKANVRFWFNTTKYNADFL